MLPANRWEEVSRARPPGHSRKGKIYSGSLEKKSSPQHLDPRDAEAWLAVTVANLKAVKVLAGT